MSRSTFFRFLVVVTAGWFAWAGWSMAQGRDDYTLMVTDGEAALAGASVMEGDQVVALTESDGSAVLESQSPGKRLTVVASGFNPTPVTVPAEGGMVEVDLLPKMLRARVLDVDGRPVEGVRVTAGEATGITGEDGRVVVEGAEPGPVGIFRPAWVGSEQQWDGGPGELVASVTPRIVKAVHVTGEAAGDPESWEYFVDMTRTTELNGVMLDLKGEEGLIWYDTEVALAHDVGSVYPQYNLAQLAAQMEEEGLYLIGRLVTFQDPVAGRNAPDIAVWDSSVDGPYQKGGQYFLDPTDPAAQQYALDLAEEACRLGVDEIQFDYVRFPDGYPASAVFDGGIRPGPEFMEARVDTLVTFLAEARDRLHGLGCAIAGDVFGVTTTTADDAGIGQFWPEMTKALDVVSPMIYPSLYGSRWAAWANEEERPVPGRAADYPGNTIWHALSDGVERLESGTVIRPWLQDFGYTDAQVREQIDATEEFGFGWMLWNPKSNVSVGALDGAE